MKSTYILIIITIFIFIKCNNNNKLDNTLFIKNINKNEAYYIIPPTICVSCNTHPISSAYEILRKKYHVKIIFECFPENYKIILTKLKNEKIINSDNYFIDTLIMYNNFDSLTLVNKPTIIYIKKGNIEDVEFLDSRNTQALNNLIFNLQK